MSRPLRIEYEGAWYHAMNRGAGGRTIFLSDAQRKLFLKLLRDISETFTVEIHAYCLMDNHYHLLVRTPRANLSQAMRYLNGVYTQRFNKETGSDGALFRGRYKAILIEADQYLLQVSRYIHCNPVKGGQCSRADEYPWSSYAAYCGRNVGWLVTGEILGMMGGNPMLRYRRFVEEGVDAGLEAYYAKQRAVPVLGSDEFIKRVQRFAKDRMDDPEVAQARHLIEPPGIVQVAAICADYFGVDTSALLQPAGRGKSGHLRNVAMWLCREPCGHPLKAIGLAFGDITYMGVAGAIRRIKVEAEQDSDLQMQVSEIRARLKEYKEQT